MSRFRSLSLLLALFVGAGLARAADALAAVDYFLPVTYNMVITRTVTTTDTATKQQTALDYELFANRDLLKAILNANSITNLAGWSLVAKGDTAAFSDSHTTDTLSSLEIVARHNDGRIFSIPATSAAGFSLIYSACTYSRTERQDEDTTPDPDTYTPVSSTTNLGRLAEFTQKIPAHGTRAAGTLVTTGYIAYTNVYNKVTVGKETTATAVLRPVGATFRASGPYTEDGGTNSDGMAEILITFGAPIYKKSVAAPAP